MKLLRIIPSVNPKSGGPIEAIKQLSIPLSELDCTTNVVCLDSPLSPWLEKFPLKVFPLGPSSTGYSYTRKFVPWLQQNAQDYDHIIVDGIWQYHSFGSWLALRNTQSKYFVYAHGMLDPWFKYTYPTKHLKKWLYWPWTEYKVLRDAEGVLFTCEEEKLLARQSFWLYNCRELTAFYTTAGPKGDANSQRQMFTNRFPELRGKRILLYLSRIHVKKGCDILIEAFAKIAHVDPALHLLIVGPDQTGWQRTLQMQAQYLGVSERITWAGMLLDDLKWGAYYSSEVFVLPSHQENFGIVVAESLACGLPVLISNKVNIWREIDRDSAGIVADDTIDGTVALLHRWLNMKPEEQQAMRQRSKQCYISNFEVRKAALDLLNCLE
jgi:glycosyltransferase involved in cell wall biosynthesis